jgi:Dockerin type I domain
MIRINTVLAWGLLLWASSTCQVSAAPTPPTPPTVLITSPLSGSTVSITQGTTLTITVTVIPNDYNVSFVVVCGDGELFGGTDRCSPPLQPPYHLTLTLPVTLRPRGDYVLQAIADTEAEQEFESPPVSFRIERSDPVVSLTVTPSILDLSFAPPDAVQLIVMGRYADGTTVDVTESNQISYQSGSSSIATVSVTGAVQVISPGNVQVLVSPAGSAGSTATPVTVPLVNQVPVFGDLNGDGQVDTRDLALEEAYLGRHVAPTDPHDLNHDGIVDILDLRLLTLQCTYINCATSAPE